MQKEESKNVPLDLWSKETEVLTENGWTNSVKIGERIATYDYETGRISFEEITAKVSRKGEADENICVCLNNHTLMHLLETSRIAVTEGKQEDCRCVAVKDFAQQNMRGNIIVGGLSEFSGIELEKEEIEFIGLVFSSGEIDLNNKRIIFEAQSDTEIAKKIEACLENLNLPYTMIRYDGFTKGNRAKKPCKYNVWYCELWESLDEDRTMRIAKYMDFASSNEILNMTQEQFAVFLSMSNSETVKDGYTFIKMRHITPEVADKIQMMALFRGHKVLIDDTGKDEKEIRVFKESVALIGNKTNVIKTNWQIIPAIGKNLWGVQTNGGGIVTRYGGRVVVVGGTQLDKFKKNVEGEKGEKKNGKRKNE